MVLIEGQPEDRRNQCQQKSVGLMVKSDYNHFRKVRLGSWSIGNSFSFVYRVSITLPRAQP